MRRLLRLTLAFAFVLSLLLGTTTAFFWLRSPFYEDRLAYIVPWGAGYSLVTGPHTLSIEYRDNQRKLHLLYDTPESGWSYHAARWRTEVSVYTRDRQTIALLMSISWPDADNMTFYRAAWWYPLEHEKFGFGWESIATSGSPYLVRPGHSVRTAAPFWFLLLLFGVWPARRAVVWIRRRRRMRAGLCLVCGYDLRAMPARCPECGTSAIPPVAV